MSHATLPQKMCYLSEALSANPADYPPTSQKMCYLSEVLSANPADYPPISQKMSHATYT